MMWYVKMYLLASIGIGVVRTVFIIIKEYNEIVELVNDEKGKVAKAFLRDKGVQKEVFGKRVVYYSEGSAKKEAAIKTASAFDEFSRKHKTTYVILFILVGIISESITWPKELYQWVGKQVVRYNEDEADPRLIKAIESATTLNELLQIASKIRSKGNVFLFEENNVFLQRILIFRDKLEEDDWDLVYNVADEGSNLEQVASEYIDFEED